MVSLKIFFQITQWSILCPTILMDFSAQYLGYYWVSITICSREADDLERYGQHKFSVTVNGIRRRCSSKSNVVNSVIYSAEINFVAEKEV